MSRTPSNELAFIGRTLLLDALVAGGPPGLNAAGHRVIHALQAGEMASPGDIAAGGYELAARLVFAAVTVWPVPRDPSLSYRTSHVVLVAVLPDRNWRGPLAERSAHAMPVLRTGEVMMAPWPLSMREGHPEEALAALLRQGLRWSPFLQRFVNALTPTDASLANWLEAHAPTLTVETRVRSSL